MNTAFFLDWGVLAFSFYNAISLLWLGVMVLLVGNRRFAGTWVTGSGLLLGALFFTSHTAILGRGLAETGLGMNFWWWMSWTPAAAAPLAWYVSMLWYTGYRPNRAHPHRVWLVVVGGLVVGVLLLLVYANPLPTYEYVAVYSGAYSPTIGEFPILILAYLAYSFLCYLLPLDLLRMRDASLSALEARSRQLARPWLMGASLAMLLSALLLAWTATWALTSTPLPSLSNPAVARTVKEFDLAVSALVALAVVCLGRSIVAYEVFTGRALPRDRFFSQWRSTVLLAGGFGLAASWTLAVELRPVYGLMLATALVTLFYALSSWRAFAEREAFMARLRPFLASQNLFDRLTAPGAGTQIGESARGLFETLCRDLLDVRAAVLAPAGRLAALAGPPLTYPADHPVALPSSAEWSGDFPIGARCLAVGGSELAWAVPLGPQGEAGVLFLGDKRSGSPFSEEEIELAQAGGERLVDLLAGSEMARLSLDLLRQRLAEARVLEGQGRRVLHDEVLPELHTALLYLSANVQNRDSVAILSAAHRRISDLLSASAPDVPARLAQAGLGAALRGLVELDYSADFNLLKVEIAQDAEERARELPSLAVEAVYFAARELVRNAARYGRGEDAGQALTLELRMELRDGRLLVSVQDDGVGPGAAAGLSASGSGLRIHSAMLAAVGGSLTVAPANPQGTLAQILI